MILFPRRVDVSNVSLVAAWLIWMMLGRTQVVLAPIVVGMMTNKFFPSLVKAVLPVTPVVGVLSTCFLVASAVAQARTRGPV